MLARNLVLLGGALRDFPYPTFPYTTIVRMRTTSDVLTSSVGTYTDNASTDSPYGISTALRLTFAASQNTIRPATFLSTPINVNNGSIRFWFKPIQGLGSTFTTYNLSTWQVRLFSAGTPSSVGSNYHAAANATWLKTLSTGLELTAGRWQSLSIPTNAFAVVGTGADLTAIKGIQINANGTSGSIMELGDVEFVPNPRSKAALIFRFDDAVLSAYTVAKPLLDAVGGVAYLAPGAVASASAGIDASGRMTSAQVLECLAAGWQFGSQCYSTEDVTALTNMSEAERVAEWKNTRNFARRYNHYRDTYDGTIAGGTNTALIRTSREAAFRTLQRFDNGNPTHPPLTFSEPFPFGDPKNIVVLNQAQNGGSGSATTTTFMTDALDQTVACKGVLILGHHNDLATNTNVLDAFNAAITYVTNNSASIEITTPRRLLAPYNGDNLTK